MNKMRSLNISLVVLIAFSAAACLGPPASPRVEPTQPAAPVQVSKPAWQQDWEKTLAAASKEGSVLALTSFGGDGRDAITRAFKEKHGLDIEFVVGRERDNVAKVQAERRAGLYLEDIYLSGTSSIIAFRNLGFLDDVKPLLILPEVLDKAAWMDGELRFIDRGRLVLTYLIAASGPIYINSDLVKPEEMRSYKDLLNPKWKGKIVVMDPTIGASGTTFFFLLWELMGPDFTRELANQDLTITTDARQVAEWLARGKHLVSGNISADIYSQFLRAGAPIKGIVPVEGTSSSASIGALSLIDRAPHPNAARVFANWLLTREAQTLVSRITETPSRRLDVTREGLDPSKILQPGIKYIDGDTEEALEKKAEMQKISNEVWKVKK